MEFLSRLIGDYLGMSITEYVLNQSDDWMPRTALGWTRVGLLAGLIAQIVYAIHTCIASSVPTFLWFSIPATFAALMIVRRALRWRYPV